MNSIVMNNDIMLKDQIIYLFDKNKLIADAWWLL